jgi:hypothetical protein
VFAAFYTFFSLETLFPKELYLILGFCGGQDRRYIGGKLEKWLFDNLK